MSVKCCLLVKTGDGPVRLLGNLMVVIPKHYMYSASEDTAFVALQNTSWTLQTQSVNKHLVFESCLLNLDTRPLAI